MCVCKHKYTPSCTYNWFFLLAQPNPLAPLQTPSPPNPHPYTHLPSPTWSPPPSLHPTKSLDTQTAPEVPLKIGVDTSEGRSGDQGGRVSRRPNGCSRGRLLHDSIGVVPVGPFFLLFFIFFIEVFFFAFFYSFFIFVCFFYFFLTFFSNFFFFFYFCLFLHLFLLPFFCTLSSFSSFLPFVFVLFFTYSIVRHEVWLSRDTSDYPIIVNDCYGIGWWSLW